MREAVPEVAQQGFLALLDRVYRTGEPFVGTEIPMQLQTTPGGPAEERFFSFVYQPLRDTMGRVDGILGHGVDVTDLVRARRLAEKQAAELEAAAEQLEATNARLAAEAAAAQRTIERARRLQRLTARLNQAVSPDHVAERYRAFPVERGRPFSEAVLRRETILVDSAAAWRRHFPGATEDLTDLGYQAFAAIPAIGSDRVIAALSFSFREPQAFDEATRTFLATLGEQCALALERARLHEAELWNAERHAALLQTIQDGFAAFDRELRYTYVNPRAEELLGRPAAELLGRRLQDVFPHAAESPVLGAIRRTLETGERSDVEGFSALANRWVGARIYPAPDGVSLVIQDVTERKRREDAAALLAEASRVLSASLDYEATLRAVAEAVVPSLGDWCAMDILADPGSDVWPPVVERVAIVHRDPAMLALAQDLAQRAAIAVDNARLFRLAERARAEAEAANHAKSQFLATMSHELRTPLNAIGGYVELMALGIRGPITRQQEEDLDRVRRSQQHLLGLINEVLNYARLETGSVRYDIEEVGVADAIAAVEALVLPQTRAKGLSLQSTCESRVSVLADAEKLRQILLNIISNAVRFTRQGGRITVGCRPAGEPEGHDSAAGGGSVQITVGDTGIGIPTDKLQAIFEPFVQIGRELNNPGEGTGLGLAISRDLARGMSGDLVVESTPGQG